MSYTDKLTDGHCQDFPFCEGDRYGAGCRWRLSFDGCRSQGEAHEFQVFNLLRPPSHCILYQSILSCFDGVLCLCAQRPRGF